MTREQALNYLRSSGFSEEQINTVVEALTEPKQGEWISVEDRLPENNQRILATIRTLKREVVRSGQYYKGLFILDNGDTWNATDIEVKAWMPLPEPYEPQERSDKE